MTTAARHRLGPGLWSGALAELADLALARSCAGCGRTGTRWCNGCAPALYGPVVRRTLGGDLHVWSAAPYDGVVQTALVGWKDRDRRDLGPVLAAAMGRAALAAVTALGPAAAPGLLVVPAPSSIAARRGRGWQPTRDLGARTTRRLRRQGTPARLLPVLRQRRGVADQAGLAAAGRATNLAGALWVPAGWHAAVRGRPVLLVDDVVTTGATLLESVRALRDAGAGPVVAVTVAATALRHS